MKNASPAQSVRAAVLTTAICLAFILFPCRPIHGEIIASVYGGVALTQDDDLRLRQTGGTDLTFHGVSYTGRDFSSPPYYGGRLAAFLADKSHWGYGVEFFHAKMYLDSGKSVHVTGARAGGPVDASERVDSTIESFSISHGLNFLMAEGIYRWF